MIGVGLCAAGMLTCLYQGFSRETAGMSIRVYGEKPGRSLVNFCLLFFCGPYIMLRMGWTNVEEGRVSALNVLLAAFIAFAWSFVTGLLILAGYIALLRALF